MDNNVETTVFLNDGLNGLVGRFLRSHIQLNRAKVYAVFCGELFGCLNLCGIAACCFTHAGVNGMTREGESACREGAEAARSSRDHYDVLHFHSPIGFFGPA
jgi:hypothetical protein